MRRRESKSSHLFYGDDAPFIENEIVEKYKTLKIFGHESPVLRNRLAGVLYLLDHSPLGVIITDLKGVITWTNEAVYSISGYKQEELHGNNMRILQSGHQDRLFYRSMWDQILSKGTWEGEIWNRRKNGEIYYQWMRISAVTDHNGEACGYASIVFDMSYRNKIQHKLNEHLYVDGLTELPSQQQLRQDIQYSFTEKGQQNPKHCLILLNINFFQEINLRYGYRNGDQILKDVGQRIEETVGSDARIYRFRNDIFAILIEHIQQQDLVTRIIEKVFRSFDQPFEVENFFVDMTPSLGVSIYPEDGKTVDELISSAEIALNAAKSTDNHFIQFSNALLNEEAIRRLVLGEAIQHAIENDEFNMHYQVVVSNEDEKPVGAEALIRWQHDQLGYVSPQEFISYAENTGLMVPLGNWILERVFKDMEHITDNVNNDKFYISINLSAKQIEDRHLIDTIKKLTKQYKVNSENVVFEVTERVAMKNVERTQHVWRSLKNLGFRLALDDFGKGESSLSFLSDFEVDIVKVDSMFITGIHKEKVKRKLTKAIFDLCRQIGVETIAEGVETDADREFLSALECNNLQGYFFSKPNSLKQFIKQLNLLF